MVCDLKQTKIWSACSQKKKKKNSWAWITAYILSHPQTISFGKVATKNRQWQQMALSREHLFPTPTLILQAEDGAWLVFTSCHKGTGSHWYAEVLLLEHRKTLSSCWEVLYLLKYWNRGYVSTLNHAEDYFWRKGGKKWFLVYYVLGLTFPLNLHITSSPTLDWKLFCLLKMGLSFASCKNWEDRIPKKF